MTLHVNSKVRVTKGSRYLEIPKGLSAQVKSIEELGADYNYNVKIALYFLNGFKSGKTISFYATHPNRLQDPNVRLRNGFSDYYIEITEK